MNDEIVRAVSADGMVTAMAITSAGLVERARQIHKTLPVATAALGRLLTVASMLGNLQKVDNGSLTLRVDGGGPLGQLLAVADAQGNVRGYVQNPGVHIMEKYAGKLDVGAAVGTNGMLTVIRDLQMKEPYIGTTQLVSGEIAEDITDYFARSEQTPTACALGVLVDVDQSVKAAGGYLIQLLPGADDATISKIEAGIQNAGAVTGNLAEGLTARQLLLRVLQDMDMEILETAPVSYRCYCSRERVERALLSIGREELQAMAEEGHSETVECQFCDTLYTFTPADIREMLENC